MWHCSSRATVEGLVAKEGFLGKTDFGLDDKGRLWMSHDNAGDCLEPGDWEDVQTLMEGEMERMII